MSRRKTPDNIIKFKQYKGKRIGVFDVVTKYPFFSNEFIRIESTSEYVLFQVASMDYRGKTHSPYHERTRSTVWYSFGMMNDYLTEGSYLVSEESNEDEVIVYLKDKI
jgi:hypothetical protein